jgi:SAM-dependent methyltransferase
LEKEITVKMRLWDVFVRLIGTNGQKERALRRFIEGQGRVLEIGCATGNVAGVFRDCDYVGVDIDADCIAFAARKHRRPNYEFHCLDVLEDELPFGGAFDYVLISHTAHHLPDDYLRRLLEKGAELLREGGELVVLDMLRPEPEEPYARQFYYNLDRGEHFRNWPEFEELFAEARWFEDVRMHLVKTTKLGIRVIDQVVICARKMPVASTIRSGPIS